MNIERQFDKTTQDLRFVFDIALNEAIGLKQEYIGTEHLLKGILLVDSSVVNCLLRTLCLSKDMIKLDLDKFMLQGPNINRPIPPLPFGANASKAFQLASIEAEKYNYISVEHLLCGLTCCNGSAAFNILQAHGLTPIAVRNTFAGNINDYYKFLNG